MRAGLLAMIGAVAGTPPAASAAAPSPRGPRLQTALGPPSPPQDPGDTPRLAFLRGADNAALGRCGGDAPFAEPRGRLFRPRAGLPTARPWFSGPFRSR